MHALHPALQASPFSMLYLSSVKQQRGVRNAGLAPERVERSLLPRGLIPTTPFQIQVLNLQGLAFQKKNGFATCFLLIIQAVSLQKVFPG